MKPVLIVCMGVSSCGKSSVGEAIAADQGIRFLEADNFHSPENRKRMASGLPLTDAMRAPWIATICKTLRLESSRGKHCVLACSALRRAHRERLRDCGFSTHFLFLDGSRELIGGWIRERTDHFMPPELLESQFAALESPLGEDGVAQIHLDRSWDEINSECLSLAEKALENG